ncbi:MAG: hydrogenase maturation nickel metallochaperone HypA [Bacteroidetes bacterium]|nr:hydrogenase maturation nickel metallochaperone HypA [Bacteroidota bacterium]
MHELSIAINIIEIVEEQARGLNAESVLSVELDIGTVAGIIPDTLIFSWEIATKGTIMENSELIINTIPARARCAECNLEFEIEDLLAVCPQCSCMQYDLLQGKELKVKSINIK